MAAVDRYISNYEARLPSNIVPRAMLGGACSCTVQYLSRTNPNTALVAGALATVASLVDSALRPLLLMSLEGTRSHWLGTAGLLASSVGAVAAGTAIVSACGLSVTAFKVAEMVATNFLIQILSGMGAGRDARPYLTIA